MSRKVLISWSGDRSKQIAELLRTWLPDVLPGVDPWLSSEDIRKGRRWPDQLAKTLEETHFGLLVVLPENQDSRWLNFEAGAISKWVEQASVAPVVFAMSPSDLLAPLSLFQATAFTKQDFLRLLDSVSAATSTRLDAPQHDKLWPQLERSVEAILRSIPQPATTRPPGTNPGQDHDSLTDEHLAILKAIESADNYMVDADLQQQLKMSRAKLEMYLEELSNGGYLTAEHIPMVGEAYKVSPNGTRYLMRVGAI